MQEPLYLHSNCELHVSLWRITNERQVWYEWYAEAFLALPGSSMVLDKGTPHTESPPESTMNLLSPVGSIVSTASSAIVDAEDNSESSFSFSDARALDSDPDLSRIGLVKIGQTSLHNPGGRSSWIGL